MQPVDELEAVQLTPLQREQMAQLLKQLDTTRIVAENFVSYFAKELGVSLSLYQFDSAGLFFAPVAFQSPPPVSPERLPEGARVTANGHDDV